MTRWVAVPQRVNTPPKVSFVVPMTADAAKAQLAYMENVHRLPNIMAAKDAITDYYEPLSNAFGNVFGNVENAKNAYLMGEATTYFIIAIVIIMMLVFVH